MGSSITKYEEIMSDREIMNAKRQIINYSTAGTYTPSTSGSPTMCETFSPTTTLPNGTGFSPKEFLSDEAKTTIHFEHKYPELANEFKNIQQEQYELFSRKMISYGRGNISLGGNLENKEDKQLSLTSIWIRMIDKMNRLKNMVVKNHTNPLEDESIEDTWRDISNYALIALLVGKDKW
jgi:hypothetical protein